MVAEDDDEASNIVHSSTFLYMPFLNANVKDEALHSGPAVVFTDQIDGAGVGSETFLHGVLFHQDLSQLLSGFGSTFLHHSLYA